jgi:hypothetical protein
LSLIYWATEKQHEPLMKPLKNEKTDKTLCFC